MTNSPALRPTTAAHRAVKRGGGIDDRRQRAIIDDHAFRGIARGRLGFGDDESHRIADMADAAVGQSRSGRDQHRSDRRDRRRARQQPKSAMSA